jgi:hypothetical protein
VDLRVYLALLRFDLRPLIGREALHVFCDCKRSRADGGVWRPLGDEECGRDREDDSRSAIGVREIAGAGDVERLARGQPPVDDVDRAVDRQH